MNNNLDNKKKYIGIIISICIALLSVFVLGNKFSQVETYSSTINTLDEKKADVLGLTAATSAASILITAIPDDVGTPLANQLADLSSYLLIVLAVIFLEKYLLVIIGMAVFYIAIPFSCLLYIVYSLNNNVSLRNIAFKLAIFGIAIMLVIPTSTWVSNKIDETYQESIILNDTESKAPNIITENNENNEDLKWYEKIGNALSNFVDSVKDKIQTSTQEFADNIKDKINNFIEATAVMIVTSCIIPIINLLIFIWLAKMILDVEITKPSIQGMKNKIRTSVYKGVPSKAKGNNDDNMEVIEHKE